MNNQQGMRSQKLMLRLQQIPYFNGLNEPTLSEIAQASIERRYASGEMIFSEGEISLGLYYVQSGWVKVIKTSIDGREHILRFVGPEEAFNELGIFAARPNSASAIALESSEVWLVPHEILVGLLNRHPEFSIRLIENLANRITYLVGMVADLSLRPVVSRLAQLLLDEAKDNVFSRPTWYTQAQFAARIGTVPDVLQRALSGLVADEIIELQRQQIRILNRPALERIASQ